jgi:Methylamine utilisation protein MauE
MIFDALLRRKILRAVLQAIQLTLGFVLLMSSLPKLCQPYDFLTAIYRYELVGPMLGVLVAAVLPWLELVVGICLIGGIFVSGSFLIMPIKPRPLAV